MSTMETTTTSRELLFLGARCRVLADSESTAGAYGLVDMIENPVGNMPPLHVHHKEDEGFLVLEGELSLFLPEQEITLKAGDFMLAPRGVPHTYRVGDSPARYLNVTTPAGFEQFVREVAALEEPTPDALSATAARHDIEILGPPGTMP
jgi:mannose-6-phosphate isomerase-like protein (cupin superfamily)